VCFFANPGTNPVTYVYTCTEQVQIKNIAAEMYVTLQLPNLMILKCKLRVLQFPVALTQPPHDHLLMETANNYFITSVRKNLKF